MTWDEVEEGQEMIAFYNFQPLPLIYKRIGEQQFFQIRSKEGRNIKRISGHSPKNCKFLPVPQDRPKPNIWDEYMEARAAWINHVLDEGK